MKVMDYTKNIMYFGSVDWAFLMGILFFFILPPLLALGALFILCESNDVRTIIAVAGTIIITSFILLIVHQYTSRPTDADIDAAVTSQLENMKARALKRLGVDEDEINEIAPISFHGYVFPGALIKQGKDGKYRSSKYQAVIFFFSSNELHCFTYDFSIIKSNRKESTDVYFYNDIVSVSTQTEKIECSVGEGKSNLFDCEYFRLTTTAGTSISCAVSNTNDVQRSINGMRSLIRSKKMA